MLYVLQLVGQVVGILAWFYALFTGGLNEGMRDLLAYWLRYQAQTYGYVMLLAIAWVLQNDNVASAITGASRPDQVAGNARAADHRLSAETMAGIDQVLAAQRLWTPA